LRQARISPRSCRPTVGAMRARCCATIEASRKERGERQLAKRFSEQ
jgi:hypothetical protein